MKERNQAVEQYKKLFETMADGILVSDSKGLISLVNPACAKIFGYDCPEEMIGKPATDFFANPERGEEALKLFEEKDSIPDLEIKAKRKDGAIIDTLSSVTLVRDSEGRLKQTEVIIRDISERKQTEEELRSSEKNYRALFESMTLGVVYIDSETKIVLANSAAEHILGLSLDQMQGKKSTDMRWKTIHEDGSNFPAETHPSVVSLNTGEIVKDVVMGIFNQNDNDHRWIRVDAIPQFRPGKAKPFQVFTTMEDITEYKKRDDQAKLQQQQLIQADKMVALGTLVSGVAHEINNPNNFIMLNAPLLQKTWLSILPILDEYAEANGDFDIGAVKYSDVKDSLAQLCQRILKGSQRIKHIVDDLRRFSRMDFDPLFVQVDVNSVVKSSVNLMENMINKSTKNFTIACDKDIPTVFGNFQKLEQVVINLIQNGCQALSNVANSLSIKTLFAAEADSVIIEVEDEGVGIHEEYMPFVFDPFFTTKRSSGGTGLGLSVSNRIITDFGGRIDLKSETGTGTVARIILPAQSTKAEGNR